MIVPVNIGGSSDIPKLVAHALPYTIIKDGQAVASAYSTYWSSGSGTINNLAALYKNGSPVTSRGNNGSYVVSGSNVAHVAGCTALMTVVKGDVISAGASPGALQEAVVWCME